MRRILLMAVLLIGSVKAQAQDTFSQDSAAQMARSRKFPYCCKLDLRQNHPDPFDSQASTVIEYSAIDTNHARLIFYDAAGQRIHVQALRPGVGRVTLPAGTFAPGKYMYALYVDGRIVKKKSLTVF
jgi:hypothetical protein